MKTHPLNSLAQRWVLDGDLIRCRACSRGQHISRGGEAFRHASWCIHTETESRPWFDLHALVTARLPRVVPNDAGRGTVSESGAVVPDFTRSLPSGLDDASYSQIETELDRIGAPIRDPDGRWLKLHERVAALRTRPGRGADDTSRQDSTS